MPKASLAAVAAVAAALMLPGAGSSATRSVLGAGALPGGWTHAEINVFVKGAAHTLVFDRGRVIAASPTGLTLREADGTPVQVPLDANTQVIVDGRSGTVADLRRGETAVTQRVDGGPAQTVRAHVPPRLARRLGRA
jgi:hypothetical protein